MSCSVANTHIDQTVKPPAQTPLFDEPRDPDTSLITIESRSAPLNKAQQLFNRLVAKIRVQRERLLQWQSFTTRHDARVFTEYLPLQAELGRAQRELVVVIDALLQQPAGGKAQGRAVRSQLGRLLLGLLEPLMEAGPDAELEAIFDRHSSVSRSELQQEELEVTEALLQDLLGKEAMRGHGAQSADELLQHAMQKMQAQAESEELARSAKRDAKREAKQQAKAAQRRGSPASAPGSADTLLSKKEQAAKEASQSVREVYRKLASALHPDRATDTADQERRTAMMKRVNQAYDANDLLGLLSIQIEIEQIDAEHLAQVSAARLTHYNQVLREQLAQLEAELESHLMPLCVTMELRPDDPTLTPQRVENSFNADLALLRLDIQQVRDDALTLADPKLRVARLKEIQQVQRDDDEAERADDFDGLMSMLDAMAFAAPQPRRRGRR